MTRQLIDLSAPLNVGRGDVLRIAQDRMNANFAELYAATGFGPDAINPLTASNFVILGASLMQRAFTDPSEAAWLQTVFVQLGFQGQLHNRATSGATIDSLIADLPAILNEFEPAARQTVYFVEIGGNDVTSARPYTAAQGNTLRPKYQSIIDAIRARGSAVILSNITYRPYDAPNAVDPHAEPDLGGALRYNTNVINSIIRSQVPDWWDAAAGRPVVDLYQWTRDRIGVISADRIHLNSARETPIVEYVLAQVAAHARGRYAPATPMSGRSVLVSASATFGSDRTRQNNVTAVSQYSGYVVDFVTGVTLPGVIADIRGFGTVEPNGDGAAAQPRIADTRFHNLQASVLTHNWFISSVANRDKQRETWGEVILRGIEPGQTGTITAVGSRAGATDTARRSLVTANGGATTGTLDAAVNAASNQVGPLPFRADANGNVVVRFDLVASPATDFGSVSAVMFDFH